MKNEKSKRNVPKIWWDLLATYLHGVCGYLPGKKTGKCRNYELDVPWNPNSVACKFFTKEHEEELKGQMNIFDFVK